MDEDIIVQEQVETENIEKPKYNDIFKKQKKKYKQKRKHKRGRKKKPGRKPAPKKRGRPPKKRRTKKKKVYKKKRRRIKRRVLKKKKKTRKKKRISISALRKRWRTSVKKYRAKVRARKLAETIEFLFGENSAPLSDVVNNEELLKEHIHFIINRENKITTAARKYKNPCQTKRGKEFEIAEFPEFKIYYPTIHAWWIHLIRSCLDPKYISYKFIGAKKIRPCREFFNSKLFCIWCLKNKLIEPPIMYKQYLCRKNKRRGYTFNNTIIINEKDMHDCKDISFALKNLFLIKKYEEGHDLTVEYMTFYTRYFMYDFPLQEALYTEYDGWKRFGEIGFKPIAFYNSVADETSCPITTFISRYNYSYNNGGFVIRPYDALRPEFSVNAVANSQGVLSYKQQYDRNRKEREKLYNPYTKTSEYEQVNNSIEENMDVYYESNDLNVYSD